MPNVWERILYFKPKEFDSPDRPGSGFLMNIEFVSKVDDLRSLCGFPLIINSGYRTKDHHLYLYRGQERIPNSAHLRGLAADIRATNSSSRYTILKHAFSIGFPRIEVAPRHIHLDWDESLPQNVAIHLATYNGVA